MGRETILVLLVLRLAEKKCQYENKRQTQASLVLQVFPHIVLSKVYWRK